MTLPPISPYDDGWLLDRLADEIRVGDAARELNQAVSVASTPAPAQDCGAARTVTDAAADQWKRT